MDAIKRVFASNVEVHGTRPHWIVRSTIHMGRKRAEAALLIRSGGPSRPLLLAANRGNAGPTLPVLADGRAVADRPAFRQHVVNEAPIGIDQDRPRHFLAVVWDDLTLIGGWDRCLPIRRVRQLLLIPRSEIWVRYRSQRCLHASAEQQSQPSRCDYDDLHDANPLVLGTRTGRPSDAPIPLCLRKTPASTIPRSGSIAGGNGSRLFVALATDWFKCDWGDREGRGLTKQSHASMVSSDAKSFGSSLRVSNYRRRVESAAPLSSVKRT